MNTVLLLCVLFSILLIIYSIFLAGILTGLKRIIKHHPYGIDENAFVKGNYRYNLSVIIPFRNESENILNNLNCIEQQDYPKELFEVIYVDDSSTDDSLEKLSKAEKSFNVKIISSCSNHKAAFKKIALKKGIESSSGEIIVTTDADTVFGKKWLSSLLEKFKDKTGLVSGPVNFIPDKGVFSSFQVLEFAGLVLTGAGLIGINNPVICNGANLAYRRKAYEGVGGFERQLDLSSGEDELLMQSISKNSSYKITFSWNKDSLVSTAPASAPAEFLRQRKRWASKTLFYPDLFLRFRLSLIFLFYLGIPVQLLLGIFFSEIFLLSLFISISSKCITEYLIIKKGEEFLYPKKILKYFFPAEMLQLFYIIISAVSGLLGRFEWKGRKLKR